MSLSIQEAEGVVMAIPMPGHPVTSQEEDGVVNDCRRLQNLIDSHDVVFLLTDTRESRWLPTLICAASNKVLVESSCNHLPSIFPGVFFHLWRVDCHFCWMMVSARLQLLLL